MGFIIESRPARGPDQGKDIIAIRTFSDDMGLLHREKWLIECKHLATSNRSVRESDIGNFEGRMKIHRANRYLLITSTTVSETVNNQLKAVSEDPSSTRMATFWNKQNLLSLLEKYKNISDRYFTSWQKQAEEAVRLLSNHHPTAHRGAILWCPEVTAIFENRSQHIYALQREKLTELLIAKELEELSFSELDDEESWVILVKSSHAGELDEWIWSLGPQEPLYISYASIQMTIAHHSIWQFHYSPMKDSC